MRVIFMGTPRFAVPALEGLALAGHQVVAVYTQPDRPAGRGRQLVYSPVKEKALQLGLTVLQPVRLNQPDVVEQLKSLATDLIVVAAFGQLLPQQVLDIPPFGCLNVHPSLLPKYRGASPVAYAILAGEEGTGVSIMLMDAGMDTGPVLRQREVPIDAQDTTGSLTEKLAGEGAELLVETLPLWLSGELRPQPQDHSQATYTKPVSKEEGEINWCAPAALIGRQVRTFQPWPGCYTRWQGRLLRIIKASPLPLLESPEPGRVVALADSGVGVGTGEGVLALAEVQLEGKRAMTAAEFVRGQRSFIGIRLPS